MKRFVTMMAIVATLVVCAALPAQAATEVKMSGYALIYGNYASQRAFTGWNTPGWGYNSNTHSFAIGANNQTEDQFQIWQRFRLKGDFVANEAVKFRLGLQVQDTWGHGSLTAANPSNASLAVYQAYLQFKIPDTDVEVTAGLQDFSLPTSSFFCDSVVWGGTRAAALIVNAPVMDSLSVVAGYSRMLDTNQTYDTSSSALHHQADELDLYFLTLPITLDGFKATPWGAVAVAGRDADYYTNYTYGWYPGSTYGENLISAGSLMNVVNGTGTTHSLWKNSQNPYYWLGGTFEVTVLDPVKFYADVIYGAGAMTDRKSSRREGWFLDLGAEYTGWDVLTPQVFGWWSTGEDKSTVNGSERMPTVVPNWGPGNSFLFDCSQDFTMDSNMGANPVGSYGFGASLNNISFIEKLTQRITFTYLHGNNSPRAIRYLQLTVGDNPYYIMGRDLTTSEQLYSVNLDTNYQIYENLAALVEAGWAHGDFQKSVWGHRLISKSHDGDAWRVGFGLKYTF